MKIKTVSFKNHLGHTLSGRLQFPADQHPQAYAIFAHCFTCNKNLNAVRHISQGLISKGIAVLSFDFTGLGQSEGEFANSSFSANIQDIISAADFLTTNYEAPRLLVGHSLGGAAVLFTAQFIESIKAIATVGAPANPAHVAHLFEESLDEIRAKGEATVKLAGRPFKITKSFVEALENNSLCAAVEKLRKSVLVLHSPQDQTVGIENAAEIYSTAKHPKSFISLDGADHLLSDKKDSFYVGNVIGSWAQRYLPAKEIKSLKTDHQVVVSTSDESYTTDIVALGHHLIADEPEEVGGDNLGTSPYGLLLSSLGACTSMTLQMYAKRKKWPLEEALVHLSFERRKEEDGSQSGIITRQIELLGDLDEQQQLRLLEIADRCPVHRTLNNTLTISTSQKK